jgi:hypothetical protein
MWSFVGGRVVAPRSFPTMTKSSIPGASRALATDLEPIFAKYLARIRVLAGEAVTLFENAKADKFASRLQTSTTKGTSK